MKKYICITLLLLSTLIVRSQEKVGININPPQFTLDVRSLVNDDPAEIHLGNPGDSRFLRFFSGSSTFIHPSLYWKDGHHLRFATDLGGYSEKMRIQGDGRVGIGTVNPTTDLQVGDASDVDRGFKMAAGGSTSARIDLQEADDSGVYLAYLGSENRLDISGRILGADNVTPSLTIKRAGNIGIGIGDPQSKLDISAQGDGVELLRLSTERPWVFKQTDFGINTNLTLQSTVDSKKFKIVGADGSTEAASFFMLNGNPKVILVPDGGSVGIGENNPGNKVRIKGSSTSTQHVLSVSSTYSGNSNIRAVEGFARPADGYGFGGLFEGGARGIQASARGGSSTNLAIGVEGSAYGTNGDRIGVFGRASGGSKNWAGYFAEGNLFVTNDVRIGLGAINGASGYKVAIDGKVIAEEMRVQLSGAWPDYVFDADYALMPLNEVEQEIKRLGHLPGIPSAVEAEKEGIMLGDMNRMLLEKIEELTLHVIRLEKELESLKSNME